MSAPLRRIAVRRRPWRWSSFAELLVVSLANRSRIASVWELQHGVLWLVPTLLGATGVVALAAAALWAIAAWGETRWARWFLGAQRGRVRGRRSVWGSAAVAT